MSTISYLYYENLPDIEEIERFRKDCFYNLSDFIRFLNVSKYAQLNRVIKLSYRILSSEQVNKMFKDMHFKFWEVYGYEMEDIINDYTEDGIFIEIFDPTGKADKHIFEDFIKSSIITDIEPNFNDRENWINVIQSYPLYNILQIDREPESKWIYFKPNTYDIQRQINAIHNLQSKPRREHLPLLKLFVSKQRTIWPNFDRVKIKNWKLLSDPNFPGITNQRNYVQIALGTPDFALLEGPPGSGKTHTICEIILQAIERNMRILLCASTHVAVDNVLEYLMDRDEVIAVRIGNQNSKSISPDAKKYLLSNRTITERKRLIKKLTELGEDKNKGQKYFLNVLKSTDGESEVERMILDNANLVCGTVIGILQHPDIKSEINTPQAVFDVLIIDEASKTTLQEFIVPAMYCSKWILVGDIKQLSPFVDDLIVRKTIDGFLNDDEKNICRDAFCSWKYPKFNTIISESDQKIRDLYKEQFQSLGLEFLDLDEQVEEKISNFLAHQIFIGTPEMIKKYEKNLPMDAYLRGGGFFLRLKYAHSYWQKIFEKEKYSNRFKGNFGEILSWRLISLFNLRFAERDLKKQEFLEDIEKILPNWKDKYEKNQLRYDFLLLKKIAFPSILEILQEGFYEYKAENQPYFKHTVSSHGFNLEDKERRYEILEYQHRMHPEISKFPRENIYKGEALRDNPNLSVEREWKYQKYTSRTIWVNVLERNKSKININLKEAQRLLEELTSFLNFSKDNPKDGNDYWEIAVLTFYSYQEDYLRTIINRKYNIKLNLQEFELPNYNARLSICTVDRFQGHEADIVFLSFVKTNSVGFLNSINRLNVAITRARYQLVMIGNKKFFFNQKISSTLKELAEIKDDISI